MPNIQLKFKTITAGNLSQLVGGGTYTETSTNLSVTSKGVNLYSVDTSALRALDILSINSVTLHMEAETSRNGINLYYGYFRYSAFTGDAGTLKAEGETDRFTSTNKNASNNPFNENLGYWTIDDLIINDTILVSIEPRFYSTLSTKYTLTNFYIDIDYTIRTYETCIYNTSGSIGQRGGSITLNRLSMSTTTTITDYTYLKCVLGETLIMQASPSPGFKFDHWERANSSESSILSYDSIFTRTLTRDDIFYETDAIGNPSMIFNYSAVYTPICVTYDTLFSFKRWADFEIYRSDNYCISDKTDTGFSLYAPIDDTYTKESFRFPVTPGKTYTIEYEHTGTETGADNEVFVFYYTATSIAWDSFDSAIASKFNFTVPEGHFWASIRCDSNTAGGTVTYNNFRVYPAEHTYMSTTVPAIDRTDTFEWSMPIPVRPGYTFKGWNTDPAGNGTYHTTSDTWPTEDLILYSQWSLENVYAGDKKVSAYVGTIPVKEIYVGITKVFEL